MSNIRKTNKTFSVYVAAHDPVYDNRGDTAILRHPFIFDMPADTAEAARQIWCERNNIPTSYRNDGICVAIETSPTPFGV